jgi:pyruvate kinase
MWGIQPRLVDFAEHTDHMTAQVDRVLYEQNLADIDDLVVIAAGSPPGQAGSTNSLRVHRVGDIADAGEQLAARQQA